MVVKLLPKKEKASSMAGNFKANVIKNHIIFACDETLYVASVVTGIYIE